MFWLCALSSALSKSVQRRKILFSTEAIPDFNALPLQARMGLLFFFCLSFACQLCLPPAGRRTAFRSPSFSAAPSTRPQLAHTASTGRVTSFAGSFPYPGSKIANRVTHGLFSFLLSLSPDLSPTGKGGFFKTGLSRFSGPVHNWLTRLQQSLSGAALVSFPYPAL